MAAPSISSTYLNADSQWNENATCYASYQAINNQTKFIDNNFVDANPNADSIPHWWLYRVRTVDINNKVSGDTTTSVQSSLFDSTTAVQFTYSADSRIFFGATHNFKNNSYVAINYSPQKNGYYYITQAGDTYISVYPTMNMATSGVVYSCNNVILI